MKGRDAVLSDAMLGYLQFVSAIGANGNNWLYSNILYKLGLPPTAVINQWQLAVRRARTLSYVNSLAPQHPQYAKMHQRCATCWRTIVRGHRWAAARACAQPNEQRYPGAA